MKNMGKTSYCFQIWCQFGAKLMTRGKIYCAKGDLFVHSDSLKLVRAVAFLSKKQDLVCRELWLSVIFLLDQMFIVASYLRVNIPHVFFVLPWVQIQMVFILPFPPIFSSCAWILIPCIVLYLLWLFYLKQDYA